jgi:glutathione S-transferase
MSTPELFQFRVSHFNEKARWALDWKGIEHLRHSLVPGPHKPKIKKLSGQEQVPVLRFDGKVVAGSNAIIDFLEQERPEPALYPRDPATRKRALEIQAKFDEEIGPAIRLAMFHELLADPGYFTRLFTWDKSALVRIGYRAIFPAVKLLMSREMKITPENAERDLAVTRSGFDFVAKESAATGYLAGDRFGVADLVAASLLAPAVEMDPSPFSYPKPYPPSLQAWWRRWREHPGTTWVKTMFARHRSVSREIGKGVT